MYYNSQDVLWRRKLEEQAELQQALELQSRRLMGLQLLDVKKHHNRSISTGSPIHSPTQSPNLFNQNLVLSSIHSNSSEAQQGNSFTICLSKTTFTFAKGLSLKLLTISVVAENCSSTAPTSVTISADQQLQPTESTTTAGQNGNGKESPRDEVSDLLER